MTRRTCYNCGNALEDGRVLMRRFRLIRSGLHIGLRGEFVTFLCQCGNKPTVLWERHVAPQRVRSAA